MKIFALEMASPGKRQCANCRPINALSLYGAIMQRLANVDDREQKQFPATLMTQTRIIDHSVDCAVWTR